MISFSSIFYKTRFVNASLSKITIFNYLFIFFKFKKTKKPKHLPHNYRTICIKSPHNGRIFWKKLTAHGRIICLFGRVRYHITSQRIPHLNVASCLFEPLRSVHKWRYHLRRRGLEKMTQDDGGRGCRAKDEVTFLHDSWETFQTI